jgi:spore cortex biosynthesis protein YabQ
MPGPVTEQAAVFVFTVGIGLLLGLLFDLYRVVRGRFRPGPLATLLGDLLFSLLATGVAFTLLVVGNWGELRLYVWVGFLLGAVSYRLGLSRPVIAGLTSFLTLAGQVSGAAGFRLARLLQRPGEWHRRVWRRSRLGQALRRWWRWARTNPRPPAPPDDAPPA